MKVLTQQLIDEIATKVRRGNYFETAAAIYGVHRTLLGNWMKTGRALINGETDEEEATDHQRMCRRLVLALEKADAEMQGEVFEDILDPETKPETRLKFAERRWARQFSRNPNASKNYVDENLADVLNLDAREILEMKIKTLLGRDE